MVQHELAKRQMRGGSGIVTADFGLDLAETLTFVGRLRLFPKAESLGGVESLCCHPASMTHASVPKETREAVGITDSLVRSGSVDLIVIDSVAALTPKAEIEGEMGDSLPGLQARLMSQALRKLTGTIKRTNCLVVFINQIRMKIGVMFGNPETTTGGNALKFYASVRLDIRRTGSIKKGDEIIGNETRVKVVKNKVAPPFKQAEFDILYGEGVSRLGEIIDLGVACNVVEKSGAWYSYGGERVGQGKDNAREFLRERPDMALEIENRVRDHYGVAGRGKTEQAA